MLKSQREISREKVIELHQLLQATRAVLNPGNRSTLGVFTGEEYKALNIYEQNLFHLLSLELYNLMDQDYELLANEVQKGIDKFNSKK